MNKDELISYIQSVINLRYAGLQAAFAQDNDLSAAYVNDVLRGRREPGRKILEAVGAERITVYRLKKGDGAFKRQRYIPPLERVGFALCCVIKITTFMLQNILMKIWYDLGISLTLLK